MSGFSSPVFQSRAVFSYEQLVQYVNDSGWLSPRDSWCVHSRSTLGIDLVLVDPSSTVPRSDDTMKVATRTLVVPKDHLYGIAFETIHWFFRRRPQETQQVFPSTLESLPLAYLSQNHTDL